LRVDVFEYIDLKKRMVNRDIIVNMQRMDQFNRQDYYLGLNYININNFLCLCIFSVFLKSINRKREEKKNNR